MLTFDPFFGLLTDPPGNWGLVAHGLDKTLVLQGTEAFLTKALNFLHSYATGRLEDDPKSRDIELRFAPPDEANRVLVTISEARLRRALRLWFYGQLFHLRADTRPVVDEEGDVVDYVLTNDAAIETEAGSLTEAFVSHIDGCALGAHIGGTGEDTRLVGYKIGAWNDGADGEE